MMARQDNFPSISPLARRIALRHALPWERLVGTGPKGRIVQEDVQKALQKAERGEGSPSLLPSPPSLLSSPPSSPSSLTQRGVEDLRAFFPKGRYREQKQEPMRKIIAQRLTASAQEIPHYSLVISCRLDALVAALDQHKEAERLKIKINHVLIFAAIKALLATPSVNVTYAQNLLYHQDAHLGIAVATDGGIMTPIIHGDAHTKMAHVVEQVDDLVARARARRLKPYEYQGGVMGVSNLGMFGVEQFSAIINPPQSSMLTLGSVTQMPYPCEDVGKEAKGGCVFLPSIKVTLVCDHRVIDGAMGAKFLSAYRDLLANPSFLQSISNG